MLCLVLRRSLFKPSDGVSTISRQQSISSRQPYLPDLFHCIPSPAKWQAFSVKFTDFVPPAGPPSGPPRVSRAPPPRGRLPVPGKLIFPMSIGFYPNLFRRAFSTGKERLRPLRRPGWGRFRARQSQFIRAGTFVPPLVRAGLFSAGRSPARPCRGRGETLSSPRRIEAERIL